MHLESYAFYDESRKNSDPWWKIISLIEDFNENRSNTVAASIIKTVDECMSSFRPQTTKTGGLPHLSFVRRKPEPLGTEFKSALCSATGIMLYLHLGDAWFTSVDLAKVAARTKPTVPDTMAQWPGGSHLVLETEVDDVKLFAIGYKYSSSRVLMFVSTDGAGHTEKGDPYVAQWTDDHGNHMQRPIFRPQVISQFFNSSNGIDVHNQLRQAIRGYMYHLYPQHRHKKNKLTLLEFADILIMLVQFSQLLVHLLSNRLLFRGVVSPQVLPFQIPNRRTASFPI